MNSGYYNIYIIMDITATRIDAKYEDLKVSKAEEQSLFIPEIVAK